MIIRARTVVTADRPPVENSAIAVCGNQIVDAGNFDQIKARHPGEVIDLGEQALLPGLINAHRENILLTTHLAESCEEMQMFHDAAGPLYEFFRHIGRPMDDCGNKSPLS